MLSMPKMRSSIRSQSKKATLSSNQTVVFKNVSKWYGFERN